MVGVVRPHAGGSAGAGDIGVSVRSWGIGVVYSTSHGIAHLHSGQLVEESILEHFHGVMFSINSWKSEERSTPLYKPVNPHSTYHGSIPPTRSAADMHASGEMHELYHVTKDESEA